MFTCRALLVALCLSGIIGLERPEAQGGVTWRITLIRVTAGGETLCSNRSLTFRGAQGEANFNDVCLNGVDALVLIDARRVGMQLTGRGLRFANCRWNITTSIVGINFISGDAVPSTRMEGVATTNPRTRECNTRVAVTGSFQAQRIGGAPPPGPGPGPGLPPRPGPAPPPPAPPPAPVPPPGGGTLANFTGTVTTTRPGGLPVPAAANAVLEPGTWVLTGPGASATLRFPDGDVALGENTGLTVFSRRFFLLTPSFHPMQGSFMRITWRCIPNIDPCASIATPNTRLAFNPPSRPDFGFNQETSDTRAAGDTAFTLSYTQGAGLGTSAITVQTGTVALQDLQGRSELINTGQTRRVVSVVPSAAAPLDLNGDVVADVLTWDAARGSWAMQYGEASTSATGQWPSAWQDPRPGFPQSEWTVQPGDFDGNGLTDFVAHNARAAAAFLAVNDGRSSFRYVSLSARVFSGARLSVLNLNGDRLSDLLFYHPERGTTFPWINTGDPPSWSTTGIPFIEGIATWAAGLNLYPMALNADDAIDVLLLNPVTGEWSWALNDGGGAFTITARGTWPGATVAAAGDFNGDRRGDALVYDARTGAWSQAMNTGTTFAVRQGGTWAPGLDVMTGDLDADGDADLLLYNSTSGDWSTAIAEGTGEAGGRFATAATGRWRPLWEVSPVHLNADGRVDFFLYYREAGTWSKAVSDGRGGFTHQEGAWAPGTAAVVVRGLTQGSIPRETIREPCASERTLQDVLTLHNLPIGIRRASVQFVNMSTEVRNVYAPSIGNPGQRVFRFTLAPGARTEEPAIYPVTHWIVTNSAGVCQAIYLSGTGPYGTAAAQTRAILP